jgi:hypothetical protein
MSKWKDMRYLQAGNSRQQRAYAVLQELAIATVLRDFDPVLAGTIPLGIDLPESDLDIICEVPAARQELFEALLRQQYGQLAGFQLARASIGGHESIVCNFQYAGSELELFGQGLPTRRQNAYRHLVVEQAILDAGGPEWRAAVVRLKRRGLKTEPAFALLLQLPGNPYDALLDLEQLPEAALRARVAKYPLPTTK